MFAMNPLSRKKQSGIVFNFTAVVYSVRAYQVAERKQKKSSECRGAIDPDKKRKGFAVGISQHLKAGESCGLRLL